jgi:P4 family phage/plasmid primase-like protien
MAMTELDDDKDEAFKAIKDSIPPEHSDPNEDQQRAIDALDRQSGFNPNPQVPFVELASKAIMKRHRFLTIEETQQVWYYKDGVYHPGGEILIAKEAAKMFDYDMTKAKLSEITAHIIWRTYHKHEEIDADINIINLKNGLYNVDKNKLLKHTPNYLSINQKSITHVKGAIPKQFGTYLKQVFYLTDIRTAVDAMAYTFHRDYDQEVIFVLLGYGRNGKTVYTSIVTVLHGRNNISNVPLTAMLGNRFALSGLENKDANIDNELTHSTITGTAVIKRLTGGSRQPVRVEDKNVKAHDTILYAKLFFNANRMPMTDDSSDAYNRRLCILALPHRFDGAKEDRHLISKLTTDEELSGIFNALMIALRRIRKNKEIYEHAKTIEEKTIKYQMAVDPIQAFLDEAVSPNSLVDDKTEKETFYKAYDRFCNKHSLPIVKYDTFGRNIKAKDITDGRMGNDDREYYWKGIRLVPEYMLEMEQTTIDKKRTRWT